MITLLLLAALTPPTTVEREFEGQTLYLNPTRDVNLRLQSLGTILKDEPLHYLKVKPSVENLQPPKDATGRRLTCPSITSTYNIRGGSSGRVRVSAPCMWLPR